MYDNILSEILYGMSGFFFAIFACRYGTLATNKMKAVWLQQRMSLAFFLSVIPSLLILTIAIFIFPILLYTKTPIGGFIYLVTYIFLHMKTNKKK
ncbi:MAG: hypothetical protein PHR07_02800 [Acidaminococcaceae bacterium]|nr:hypothetical protein [Acidaminococcaceae bacterium]